MRDALVSKTDEGTSPYPWYGNSELANHYSSFRPHVSLRKMLLKLTTRTLIVLCLLIRKNIENSCSILSTVWWTLFMWEYAHWIMPSLFILSYRIIETEPLFCSYFHSVYCEELWVMISLKIKENKLKRLILTICKKKHI